MNISPHKLTYCPVVYPILSPTILVNARSLSVHPIAGLMCERYGKKLEELRAQIEIDGQAEPIWIDAQSRVIDGRARVEIARMLDIPVVAWVHQVSEYTIFKTILALAASKGMNKSQRAMYVVRALLDEKHGDTCTFHDTDSFTYELHGLPQYVRRAITEERHRQMKWEARREFVRENRRVYVAHSRDFIKVGISCDPVRRIKQLRQECPNLRLALYWSGTFQDEKNLHTILEPFRIRGEWFENSPYSRAKIFGITGHYISYAEAS